MKEFSGFVDNMDDVETLLAAMKGNALRHYGRRVTVKDYEVRYVIIFCLTVLYIIYHHYVLYFYGVYSEVSSKCFTKNILIKEIVELFADLMLNNMDIWILNFQSVSTTPN